MIIGIIGSVFTFILKIVLTAASLLIRAVVWLISSIFVGIFKLFCWILIKIKRGRPSDRNSLF